jgi:hypothetical protein
MVVSTNNPNGVYDSGAVFNAGSQGTNTIVQTLPNGGQVDADLATFIQTNTGGAASPYAWSSGQLGQSTVAPAGAANAGSTAPQHYANVSVNGQIFTLPVVDCPAASCQNGSPIAWASSDSKDQAALQAFKEASLRAGVQDVTTIVVAGVAAATLGASLPLTTAAGIGAGTAAAMDAAGQFNNNGSVNLGQTSFTAFIGGSLWPMSTIPGLNGYLGAGFLGGAGNTATTAFNNWINGEAAPLGPAAYQGAIFVGIGYGFGQVAGNYLTKITPQGFTPDPKIPALLQTPYSTPSTIPANGSAITSGLIGGIPSSLPSQSSQ